MRITSHSFLRFAVPVAVLLLLFASSVFIFQVRTKEYESWTTAPGTVLEVEWVRDFRVRIYYNYAVAGKSYTGSDLYHRSSEMVEEGAKVLIWYDRPIPIAVPTTSGAGAGSYGVYFLMIPLAIAWFGKNRRKESSGFYKRQRPPAYSNAGGPFWRLV